MVDTVEQERTISGRGLVKLDDRFRECKRIILYASVIRKPKSEYLNVAWSPDRGFFANATFGLREYAGDSFAMNYEQQMFLVHENDCQQLGSSLVCALDNILDSFVQYAVAQGIPYVKNNSITPHKYSAFIYDTLRFVCYGGAAISLRLVGEKVEKCKEGDAPSDYPPPPPPPSQAPVPPGTPIEVDPPYPDEPPQRPDTLPDPIDEYPATGACASFSLSYRLTSLQFPAPGLEANQPFVGEFQGMSETPGSNPGSVNLGFFAGQTVGDTCVPNFYYSLFENLETPYEFEILEIRAL